jgi:topoisomerase IV subunit A
VKELPSGGRGVIAIKLHDKEAMLGVRPATAPLQVAAVGRSDKRIVIAVSAKELEHYRGARARSGRKLDAYFKKVDGFID